MANIRPKTLSFNKDGNTYTLRGITTTEEIKIANAITEHQDISGKLNASEKGAANGIAELDANGLVPSSQLPSVDTAPTENSQHLITSGGVAAALPGQMTGATSSAAGTGGLVPAPAQGDQDKFLKGDGTWGTVDALPVVTSSDNGKFLQVSNGSWAAVTIPNASGVSF